MRHCGPKNFIILFFIRTSTQIMIFYVFYQLPGSNLIFVIVYPIEISPSSISWPYYTSLPISNFEEVGSLAEGIVAQAAQLTLALPPSDLLLASPSQELPAAGRVKRRRKQCVKKELESARKNCESNLINQFMAFLSSWEQSDELVNRAIRRLGKKGVSNETTRAIFYKIVRVLNCRRGRKYVNHTTLLRFYSPATLLAQYPDIEDKCLHDGILTLPELSYLFRLVSYEFIRSYSVAAVLTSKRLSLVAKPDHLKRRRVVQSRLHHRYSP